MDMKHVFIAGTWTGIYKYRYFSSPTAHKYGRDIFYRFPSYVFQIKVDVCKWVYKIIIEEVVAKYH